MGITANVNLSPQSEENNQRERPGERMASPLSVRSYTHGRRSAYYPRAHGRGRGELHVLRGLQHKRRLYHSAQRSDGFRRDPLYHRKPPQQRWRTRWARAVLKFSGFIGGDYYGEHPGQRSPALSCWTRRATTLRRPRRASIRWPASPPWAATTASSPMTSP